MTDRARLGIGIRGAVQGVGFRPFVWRLAHALGLAGWVVNDARGVVLEVEGPRAACEAFLARVGAEAPPAARIHALEHAWLAPAGFERFEIRASDGGGERRAALLPDLATCPACLAETRDPAERRHRYPFTNCTECGPRFTIVRALPYDRPNTTMAGFALCAECAREYADPADRRFHAQPIACPRCGPSLALTAPDGAPLARGDDALRRAAAAVRDGEVVAVKGLGGYHLVCDAADAAAVARLRERKPRHEKPFAIMARDLDEARALCAVDDAAAEALTSSAAPILLLPRRPGAAVAANVAPGMPTLGVMLPATPLHHLLLAEVGRAVVATSGNLTDEPIATDDAEARARLGHVADLFLAHDRPIERHVDDSVAWVVGGEVALLRRARGFAPLPVRVRGEWPPVLAVGAHLKNTVALAVGPQVFVSQHVGDLETPEAMAAFERVIADFLRMYGVAPAAVAHDLHPDYVSTQWARRFAAERGVPLEGVQHHHAHLAACLAEHGVEGRALGVTWDGTGYGADGTVWGGEFLSGDAAGFERVAHLRPFRLPGGEAAVEEPRRTAVALLWETFGAAALERLDLAPVASFGAHERGLLERMLERGVSAPLTTSAGRLFDGLAALVGLHPRVTFEGQAAMAFEFAADPDERGAYPVHAVPGPGPLVLDWRPLVEALVADLGLGVERATIAARAHGALVHAIVAVAAAAGEARVALTGGCFQNRRLLEATAAALRARGHEVLTHRVVPPNDGGVSLGQAAVAAARRTGR
uniref:Carbamoyltransferase n=1 Tax=Eiseniibacteriota bacterium TaxID=2212470 RepID=A0A832I2F7_UNCEI